MKNRKRPLLLVIFLILLFFMNPVFPKMNDFLVGLKAGMTLPAGYYEGIFKAGPSIGFYGMYNIFWKYLYLDADLAFGSHTPESDESSGLSILSLNSGPLFFLPFSRWAAAIFWSRRRI